jgi:hypothetical protein
VICPSGKSASSPAAKGKPNDAERREVVDAGIEVLPKSVEGAFVAS